MDRKTLIPSVVMAVCFVAVAGVGGRSEPLRVAVLSSRDASPYRQAVAGFERRLEQHVSDVTVDVLWLDSGVDADGPSAASIRAAHPTLLLALGSRATRFVKQEFPDTSTIASMILDAGEIEGLPNAAGVVLGFPVETELEWLRRVLPDHRRIGVLYNPQTNSDRVAAARESAAAMDCEIVAVAVESPREIPAALKTLARRVDVLWGFPDSTVFSPETAKQILLFSFRNRIPMIGLSERWVEAGALFALDRDYDDLGAQCADMALGMVRDPGGRSSVGPRTVAYSLNLKTAERMKVDVPKNLRSGAKRVFE